MMLNKLHLLLRRGFRSPVGKNALSLYLIQFANYVLPFITVPYLVRVLGPERYGTLAFGQGLMAYFSTAVSYGFNWSATRKISVERDNPETVSRTAMEVWGAKSLLCAGCFLCLLILVWAVPRVHQVSMLMLVLFCGVVGGVLFPSWLFQGLERMGPISAINLTVRLLTVVVMFILVRSPRDFLVYAALLSGGSLLAGIAGSGVAIRTFGIRLQWPSWRGIWQSLREGCVLFLSSAAIVLYTSGNAFILGLVASDTVVGYYTAAERIIKAVTNIWGPLSQALFPRFSRMVAESRRRTLRWGRRLLYVMGGMSLLLSAGVFAEAGLIVKVILGSSYSPSVSVVRILALLPFLLAVSNVLGVQMMIPFGRERAVLFLVLGAGCLNVVLAALMAPVWKADGMAVSVLAAETFVTFTYFVYLWRAKLNPLQSTMLVPQPESCA
jgi:O-antigen/teichoic acid export membrane protein